MMSQADAVYAAIVAVKGENHGVVRYDELTRSEKEEIFSLLERGFLDGTISLKSEKTPEEIRKYIPGLVNNWCRKDKRLNGGEKYVTKNPGSRAGASDPTLKALKALLANVTDPVDRVKVEAAIKEREELLKPKKPVIDPSLLPEHLRHLVQN